MDTLKTRTQSLRRPAGEQVGDAAFALSPTIDNGHREGLRLRQRLEPMAVEAHGGTVVAEHAPGQGAAFTVRVPGAD